MPTINTGAELEVLFTPTEKNVAMQLMDKNLSIMYLTNTKLLLKTQLAEQQFSKPEEDVENQRIRAYLKGQYDLLTALIDGALNPEPVPVQDVSQPSPLANLNS